MVDLVLSGSADYMTHYAGLKHLKKSKIKKIKGKRAREKLLCGRDPWQA